MNYRPIQRILVPVDNSDYSKSATLRACEIAKSHFAQVSGLAVLDLPHIAASAVPGDFGYWPVFSDALDKLTESARERLDAARNDFSDTCALHGVCHQQTDFEGAPADRILEASILFDLVVIGLRTCFRFECPEESSDSLAEVLGRTVTPVLAVPANQPAEHFRKVVITFDGSFSAARTLRDFVAFAQPYEFDITVLTACKEDAQAKRLLDVAGSYLRSHDIEKFETVRLDADGLSPGGVPAIDDADLVVAGIHSRHLLRDLIVGSFTRSMIDRGDKALFLSH